jgi:hypothetical protein
MASPRFLVLTGMRQRPLNASMRLLQTAGQRICFSQSETIGRLKFNLPPVR